MSTPPDQVWIVPNTAGLPTKPVSEVLVLGGLTPHIGKGALLDVQPPPGSTQPPGGAGTPITFNRVDYDDLGFTRIGTDPTKLFLPDVDPPIQRVDFTAIVSWPSTTTATQLVLLVRRDAGLFLDDGLPFDARTPPSTGSSVSHTMHGASVSTAGLVPGATFWQVLAQHDDVASLLIAKASFTITVQR